MSDEVVYIKTPKMKFIAVSYGGSGKMNRFEETEYFDLYAFTENKKIWRHMLSVGKKTPSDMASYLSEIEVDAVICRSFSPKALSLLKNTGIVCYDFAGGPGTAIKAWRKKELTAL